MRLEPADDDRLSFTFFDKFAHGRIRIDRSGDGVRSPAFQKNIARRDLLSATELERFVGSSYSSPRRRTKRTEGVVLRANPLQIKQQMPLALTRLCISRRQIVAALVARGNKIVYAVAKHARAKNEIVRQIPAAPGKQGPPRRFDLPIELFAQTDVGGLGGGGAFDKLCQDGLFHAGCACGFGIAERGA